jgi:hypothetical protein
MKLVVYWTDTRGGYMSKVSFRTEVIDEDTGKEVGFVEATRSPIERRISLFGGKYQGDFETHEECKAFAKGVEAVLNHAVEVPDQAASQAA